MSKHTENMGKTKSVSVKTIIYCHFFMSGYKDYINKKPYNDNYDTWCDNDQINYERGRHYAALFKDINPKNGKKVSNVAILAASIAINKNYII